jgi:hypothetical protein
MLDERGRRGEERLEAVLHSAVSDRDGEVRLAATGLAEKDHGATFGDEVWGEQRADGRQTQRRLVTEIEFFDGAQKRKRGGAHCAAQARAATMRDFLGDQRVKKLLVGPLLLLGALDQVAPHAARIGEMEAFEERIEIGAHRAPRFEIVGLECVEARRNRSGRDAGGADRA